MAKIRRFNEQKSYISSAKHMEHNGEIWISKKDVVNRFNIIIKELIEEDDENNNIEIRIRKSEIMKTLIDVLGVVRDGFKRIGGEEINPIDPYNEENWDR